MIRRTIEVEESDNENHKKHLDKYQTRMIYEANGKKKVEETANQYCTMTKNSILYSRKMMEKSIKDIMSRDTKAFICLIMNKIMRVDTEGTRSDNDQADFKTKLCRHYNALQKSLQKLSKISRKDYQFQNVWCLMLQKYLFYEDIKATHIVPRFFGPTSWQPSLVKILLASTIERLFDEGYITIVPIIDLKEEIELKFRVLE